MPYGSDPYGTRALAEQITRENHFAAVAARRQAVLDRQQQAIREAEARGGARALTPRGTRYVIEDLRPEGAGDESIAPSEAGSTPRRLLQMPQGLGGVVRERVVHNPISNEYTVVPDTTGLLMPPRTMEAGGSRYQRYYTNQDGDEYVDANEYFSGRSPRRLSSGGSIAINRATALEATRPLGFPDSPARSSRSSESGTPRRRFAHPAILAREQRRTADSPAKDESHINEALQQRIYKLEETLEEERAGRLQVQAQLNRLEDLLRSTLAKPPHRAQGQRYRSATGGAYRRF